MKKKFEVIEFLMEISSNYSKLGNNIKAGSFARTANAIKDSALEDFDEDTKVTHLHGVGKSAQIEVTEFVTTGTSERLDKLKEELRSQEEVEGHGSALANMKDLISKARGK